MKFLQLRHALETALGIRSDSDPTPEPKIEPRTIPLYDPDKLTRRRELVAGGEILWKPVNKTAVMVIAKAPWWAKPPQTNEIIQPVPILERQHKPKRPRLPHKPKRKPAPSAEAAPIEAGSKTPTPPPDRQCQPQKKSTLTREEVAAMFEL